MMKQERTGESNSPSWALSIMLPYCIISGVDHYQSFESSPLYKFLNTLLILFIALTSFLKILGSSEILMTRGLSWVLTSIHLQTLPNEPWSMSLAIQYRSLRRDPINSPSSTSMSMDPLRVTKACDLYLFDFCLQSYAMSSLSFSYVFIIFQTY